MKINLAQSDHYEKFSKSKCVNHETLRQNIEKSIISYTNLNKQLRIVNIDLLVLVLDESEAWKAVRNLAEEALWRRRTDHRVGGVVPVPIGVVGLQLERRKLLVVEAALRRGGGHGRHRALGAERLGAVELGGVGDARSAHGARQLAVLRRRAADQRGHAHFVEFAGAEDGAHGQVAAQLGLEHAERGQLTQLRHEVLDEGVVVLLHLAAALRRRAEFARALLGRRPALLAGALPPFLLVLPPLQLFQVRRRALGRRRKHRVARVLVHVHRVVSATVTRKIIFTRIAS
jgi:hypothetical protein